MVLETLYGENIDFNQQNLNQFQLKYNKIVNEIRQVKRNVIDEIQKLKLFKKRCQSNIKQIILRLRKELLDIKKKNHSLQHQINQRNLSRHTLTKYNVIAGTGLQFCFYIVIQLIEY
mgnify:CR=1 FL=1